MTRLTAVLALALSFGLFITACDSGLTGEQASPDQQSDVSSATQGTPSVLEITAVHDDDQHRFELSEDEISSGWTTIELDNQTEATHFAFLRKASQTFLDGLRKDEGEVSAEALINAAAVPFQEEWDPYFEGDIPAGTFFVNLAEAIPNWFFAHRPIGGPGLTSGGETSATTQNLEPGVYFVECYVLGENGQFHTLGMVEKFKVTDDSSGASEPNPTMRVSIDDDGIEVEETQGPTGVRPGQHTVAVAFEENGTSSGNDLHLFRFDDDTTVEELNAWMDWPDIGPDGYYNTDAFGPALTSHHDAPGPQTWLGGVQDIRPPLPETAYFHVQLKPGEYAWVAEIPNPEPRGFLKTFTVPFGQDVGR